MKPRNNNRQFPYEVYDYSIEKSHRTTGFVILIKFWSRNDLRHRRNPKFLVDTRGAYRCKQTDSIIYSILDHEQYYSSTAVVLTFIPCTAVVLYYTSGWGYYSCTAVYRYLGTATKF